MTDYTLEVEVHEREVHVIVIDVESDEKVARVKFSDELWRTMFHHG